jgi:predicted ribosome quality control (RQC) complex YloA/Tae2 family protein
MPLGSSQKANAVWNNIIERMERKLQDEEKNTYLRREGSLLLKVHYQVNLYISSLCSIQAKNGEV